MVQLLKQNMPEALRDSIIQVLRYLIQWSSNVDLRLLALVFDAAKRVNATGVPPWPLHIVAA